MIILEDVCKNFFTKKRYIEPYSELAKTMSDVLRTSTKNYFKESETNRYIKIDYVI